MNIVITFRNYLFSQKKAPGAITIKNYVSDVRKFIEWYQLTFNLPFSPEGFSQQAISQYQTYLQSGHSSSLASVSSVKRYMSSLRKFASYLHETGMINTNPFSLSENKPQIADPYFLKSFKNYLYSDRASKLTIKNYITDINQFIIWLEQVTEYDKTDASSLLTKIDNVALEEYKARLLYKAKLSPISINRKLSSLRKYIRWLNEKGIAATFPTEPEFPSPTPEPKVEDVKPEIPELPLTSLRLLTENKKPAFVSPYSAFAPIRLAQKTKKIITQGTDLLFFNPIAQSIEAIQYLFWKSGKKIIFAPVLTILESSSNVPKGISIKTIIPKATNLLPPRSANATSVLKKVLQYSNGANPNMVRNYTKALYAPLEISTKHMHWMQKIIFCLQYKRPKWYKKYHSYTFTNYVHYAILMVVCSIAGVLVYQTWNQQRPFQSEAVLAAHDTAPPRTLSFQGRLLDKTNTPITAETPLRFALYNSPTATGTAILWQEKQDIKPDHNGYFTALLGKKSHLYQSMFTDNPSLYLGIAIGDNQELIPRQQIPTTDYAANSKSVEGLKPITDNPDVTQNVLLALDSSGNLTIGGTQSHTFQATGGQLSVAGQSLLLTTNPGSNGNVQINPDGSGIIDLQKPIQNTSNNNNRSGIPGAVEVDDILSILATTSSQSALVINQNGSGDIISARSDGIDKLRLDKMGNAFLGGDLILRGDTIDTNSTVFDIGGPGVKTLNLGGNATALSLGASSGITSINNSIAVQGESILKGPVTTLGLVTTDAGIDIPAGQKLTLEKFALGAIPFINGSNQLVQNATNFSWNDALSNFRVVGSVCVNSTTGGTCDTTPGTITIKTVETSGTADLAENYISSQNLEPGDVVAPEGLDNTMAIVKATKPYQHDLIGIISTNPGVTLNSDAAIDAKHPHLYPLALQGRVPVKVSSINGLINPGDDLTSSSIPGVAMKASESGQIIGKALESYNNASSSAIGKIMVFVNLSYYNAPTTITDNGSIAVTSSAKAINNDTKGLASDQNASSSASLTPFATGSGQLQFGPATATASAIYNSIASPSASASLSATPTPVKQAFNQFQTGNLASANINTTQYASLENAGAQFSYVPNFKSDFATFNEGLIALGPSSLTDVAVSDMLLVNNNLKITADSLDTIGTDLNIETLRQGNISFQGGLVAIDTQGDLKVGGNATFAQDVTVNGQLATGLIAPVPNHDLVIDLRNNGSKAGSSLEIANANGNHVVQVNQSGDVISSGEASFNTITSHGFSIIRGAEADTSNTETISNGSGGTGTITAHQTQRTIFTPYVTSHSLIYVTAASNTGNVIPYVARQTAEDQQKGTRGSFTIAIPYTVSRNINFNWWIVN